MQERLSKAWMCNLSLTTFDVVLPADAFGGTLDGSELHSHRRIPVAMGWGSGSQLKPTEPKSDSFESIEN